MKITYLLNNKPISHTMPGVTNIEFAIRELMLRYNFFYDDIIYLENNGKVLDPKNYE